MRMERKSFFIEFDINVTSHKLRKYLHSQEFQGLGKVFVTVLPIISLNRHFNFCLSDYFPYYFPVRAHIPLLKERKEKEKEKLLLIISLNNRHISASVNIFCTTSMKGNPAHY